MHSVSNLRRMSQPSDAQLATAATGCSKDLDHSRGGISLVLASSSDVLCELSTTRAADCSVVSVSSFVQLQCPKPTSCIAWRFVLGLKLGWQRCHSLGPSSATVSSC